MRIDIFGWFSDTGIIPEHDPGLGVNCIFCGKKLSSPIKTISLMKDGDNKSYFYRSHKDCYEQLSNNEITEIESSLIDNI